MTAIKLTEARKSYKRLPGADFPRQKKSSSDAFWLKFSVISSAQREKAHTGEQ
jgi:hypothetical protein